MFAYCNNNPIIATDLFGNKSVLVDTVSVSKNEQSVEYKTTITVDTRQRFLWWTTGSKKEYSFTFSVSSEGIVSFDNSQEMATCLKNKEIRLTLAKEMIRVAREQIPEALEGRTAKGVAFELYAHYLGKENGIKIGHTNTTEIGSNVIGAIGYDSNADWFENTFSHLPDIAVALFGSDE